MKLQNQLLPLVLTVLTFAGLVALLFLFLSLLNLFPIANKISLQLHPIDILVGLTIYLKTAIDFAIFIGNLMHTYPGVKNRIAIELGTAAGNALGTILILTIWTFFKEVPLLLFAMIVLAALVLLQMAEEGLEDYLSSPTLPLPMTQFALWIFRILAKLNKFFAPLVGRLLPHVSFKDNTTRSFTSLFFFSLTIPFVLGLDDFAGYIPLFSIINVFGFATGVFLGHMVLNLSLFASPTFTTKIVRLPAIQLLGGVVFIGLAAFGLYEAWHVLLHAF